MILGLQGIFRKDRLQEENQGINDNMKVLSMKEMTKEMEKSGSTGIYCSLYRREGMPTECYI